MSLSNLFSKILGGKKDEKLSTVTKRSSETKSPLPKDPQSPVHPQDPIMETIVSVNDHKTVTSSPKTTNETKPTTSPQETPQEHPKTSLRTEPKVTKQHEPQIKDKKLFQSHGPHSVKDTVQETRDTLEGETRRKIRSNYSPSIIVRELPSDEKSDVDDLADLLGPEKPEKK